MGLNTDCCRMLLLYSCFYIIRCHCVRRTSGVTSFNWTERNSGTKIENWDWTKWMWRKSMNALIKAITTHFCRMQIGGSPYGHNSEQHNRTFPKIHASEIARQWWRAMEKKPINSRMRTSFLNYFHICSLISENICTSSWLWAQSVAANWQHTALYVGARTTHPCTFALLTIIIILQGRKRKRWSKGNTWEFRWFIFIGRDCVLCCRCHWKYAKENDYHNKLLLWIRGMATPDVLRVLKTEIFQFFANLCFRRNESKKQQRQAYVMLPRCTGNT